VHGHFALRFAALAQLTPIITEHLGKGSMTANQALPAPLAL